MFFFVYYYVLSAFVVRCDELFGSGTWHASNAMIVGHALEAFVDEVDPSVSQLSSSDHPAHMCVSADVPSWFCMIAYRGRQRKINNQEEIHFLSRPEYLSLAWNFWKVDQMIVGRSFKKLAESLAQEDTIVDAPSTYRAWIENSSAGQSTDARLT